jgi:tetratricopeptide (TPR) repeat protein
MAKQRSVLGAQAEGRKDGAGRGARPPAESAAEGALESMPVRRTGPSDFHIGPISLTLEGIIQRALKNSSSVLDSSSRGIALRDDAPAEVKALHNRALANFKVTKLRPLFMAGVLSIFANDVRKQGDLIGAQSLFERALAIRKKALGPTHVNIAHTLADLASLLCEQGDLVGARIRFGGVLAIREKTRDPEDRDFLDRALVAKSGIMDLIETEASLDNIEAEHDAGETSLDTKHRLRAASLELLARVNRERDDLAKAQYLYEMALGIREKVLGPAHLSIAFILVDLANLLRGQGDLARARVLYGRAFALRKVLGQKERQFLDSRLDAEYRIADFLEEEVNPSIFGTGRVTGGTETPAAQDVNSANARKNDLLKRYRVDPDEPVAVTVAFMSTKDRQAFLDLHYASRASWAKIRSEEPTPAELRAWADQNFPDRREMILVISDLQHLDKEAYLKVMHWRRRLIGNEKDRLLTQLGFPSKQGKFSKTLAAFAPAGAEMFDSLREGDPVKALKVAQRINRARRHVTRHAMTKK